MARSSINRGVLFSFSVFTLSLFVWAEEAQVINGQSIVRAMSKSECGKFELNLLNAKDPTINWADLINRAQLYKDSVIKQKKYEDSLEKVSEATQALQWPQKQLEEAVETFKKQSFPDLPVDPDEEFARARILDLLSESGFTYDYQTDKFSERKEFASDEINQILLKAISIEFPDREFMRRHGKFFQSAPGNLIQVYVPGQAYFFEHKPMTNAAYDRVGDYDKIRRKVNRAQDARDNYVRAQEGIVSAQKVLNKAEENLRLAKEESETAKKAFEASETAWKTSADELDRNIVLINSPTVLYFVNRNGISCVSRETATQAGQLIEKGHLKSNE